MKYIIQTDMSTDRHSQPLFWTGTEVVGILRSNEAKVYNSRAQVKKALAAILPDIARFYDLYVRPESKRSRLPRLTGTHARDGEG